jgi:hypothetical protein
MLFSFSVIDPFLIIQVELKMTTFVDKQFFDRFKKECKLRTQNSFFSTLEHRDNHILLIPFFKSIYSQLMREDFFDPITVAILNNITNLSFIPCLLLASFYLRFSELDQIIITRLINDTSLNIYQSKTRTFKYVENVFFPLLNNVVSFKPDTPLRIVSYGYLVQEIARVRKILGVEFNDVCNDETHIFRHLFATWQTLLESSASEISSALGHRNPATLEEYIHLELADKFKQFNYR